MLELLAHVRQHRYVLQNFVVRDLKVKYRGTVFGYLWSLLEPLSLVAVYWFVFVVIAERGGPDYPLVVILGVLPFQFLSTVVTGGAAALVANAALIRRVNIPRDLFVIALVGSNLVVLLLSLLVTIPFLVVYGVVPGWRLVFLPLGIGLLASLAAGLGLALACAQAFYRDVGYVLRVVLRLGFYASPVIYPVEMVPEGLRPFYLLNPVAVLIEVVRTSVMDQPFPFELVHLASAGGTSILALWLGARLFRRWEPRAVKHL